MVLFAMVLQATFIIGVLTIPPTGCLETPPPPSCQTVLDSIATARAAEKQTWVVDVDTDNFYQTPQNASSYLPGNVIKFDMASNELLQKYKIPAGLSLYRLMYQSTDIDDHMVPATAFALLPYSHPRNVHGKPLEVIVWAHGTSGIDRPCAPSNFNNLYYDFEAPFAMALQGFAVIAPDYAGLGTNTTFNYEAGPSHAADVVYAVRATRQVLSDVISEKWVVVGHSEGGMSAWATNEREARQPTPGFLGAVSIAPALAGVRILQTSLKITGGHLGDSLGEASYVFQAIARLDKSVNVTKYYSQLGFERATLASTACFPTAITAFENLTFSEVFQDQSWVDAAFSQAWENRTGVHGEKRLAKPMLVIEGLSDTVIPTTVIDDAFETQCKTHHDAKVHLSKYPNMDHDPVAFVSQLEYFNWIREIFKGNGPQSCKTETIGLVIPNATTST